MADDYKRAHGVEDVTVSARVFGDSKKIAALRGGADITVGRFNAAMSWFSRNWPADLNWPASILRPDAPQDADRVATSPSAAPSAADGAFSHEVAG